MTERLIGKIAIVSGAGRGMGVEHVRQLVAEGAQVFGFDIGRGEGPGLVEEIGEDRFYFQSGNVTSEADWTEIVNACRRRFGLPTVLVNNAGIFRANRAETVSEKEYRAVVDVNQIGTYLGMKSVIGSMREAGGGSIVNICSTAGLVGYQDNFSYAASKWAVRGMTKAASLELAVDNIRVNAVCPGETETPMIMNSNEAGTAIAPEEFPFRRWAKPKEISAAVLFLASDESSYMSGSDVVVDGAYKAG